VSNAEAPIQSHAGRVIAGKYRLDERVGAGGMGEVYRAEHLTLRMPVAVKLLLPQRSAEMDVVRRFYREARASAQLNHPNVVRVIDFGKEGDQLPFMVMEWLEGSTLHSYLKNFAPIIPLDDLRDIMVQVLSGFEAAHELGIIHRDVKPENMFVTEAGGRRIVKILDFGLAHVEVTREEDAGPTLTKSDALAGTPEYMSPEQCRSLAVGYESDIYSLGCVLTTMLQGKPPFCGGRVVDTLSGHLFLPPPPINRPANSEPVPPLLERLRLDMLAKLPERRPSTMQEVKERLLAALDPNSLATELITRKGDAPLGSRASRVPRWEETAPTIDLKNVPERVLQEVLHWTLAPSPGVDEACRTGLAAQGIHLLPATSAEDAVRQNLSALVLDAGEDIDGAVRAISALRAKAPGMKVIVCAAGLVPQKMTQLVSAGAADALGAPASPDLLAKKVGRVLRRGR
jgi:eukaryotic-like serine/threonine-protein kinase